MHTFLEMMGLRPLARRETAQVLTRVMERSQGATSSQGSELQLAYQETRESMTFPPRDLANKAVVGQRPLYVIAFLGAP